MKSAGKGILKFFLGLIGLALLLVGVYLALTLSSKSPLPPLAKEHDVSLTPTKKTPGSKAWTAYLTGKTPAPLSSKSLDKLKAMLRTKAGKARWYPDLVKAQKALAASAKVRGQYLGLLQGKGCPPLLPNKAPKDPNKRLKLIHSVNTSRLLGMSSVALAQAGNADAAAKQLLQALRGLLAQEKRCSANLISAMIRVAEFGVLQKYLLYAALHPKLSVSVAKEIVAVQRRIIAGKHNPMPDGLRHELAYLRQAMKSVGKTPGDQGAVASGSMMVWPMWDPALTMKWLERRGQEDIHRASQPFGPALWKQYPVEKFFAQVPKMGWRLYVRYNAVGLILLSVASAPYNKFIGRWHQNRCLAAAVLARMGKAWQQDPTKAALASGKEKNPLTKQAFGSFGKGVCVIRKSPKATPMLKAKKLPLPPAPPQAAAAPTAPPKRPTPRRK